MHQQQQHAHQARTADSTSRLHTPSHFQSDTGRQKRHHRHAVVAAHRLAHDLQVRARGKEHLPLRRELRQPADVGAERRLAQREAEDGRLLPLVHAAVFARHLLRQRGGHEGGLHAARTALRVGGKELERQCEARESTEHGAARGHLGDGAELADARHDELDGGGVAVRARCVFVCLDVTEDLVIQVVHGSWQTRQNTVCQQQGRHSRK